MMMLTTMQGEKHVSRPMALQQFETDGTLWFFTSSETEKTDEMLENPQVNASYASPNKSDYVSVSGTATILKDRAKIEELWNPFVNAWFEGPDDPKLVLVRVDLESAEYWSSEGGKLAQLFQMASIALTGKDPIKTENETVTL